MRVDRIQLIVDNSRGYTQHPMSGNGSGEKPSQIGPKKPRDVSPTKGKFYLPLPRPLSIWRPLSSPRATQGQHPRSFGVLCVSQSGLPMIRTVEDAGLEECEYEAKRRRSMADNNEVCHAQDGPWSCSH